MHLSFRTSIRAIGLGLLLSLSACGGNDDEAAAEAISKSFMEEQDETFEITQDQADCLGDGFVDEIGVEKLQDYGILTNDLEPTDTEALEVEMSEEDADAAADVMIGCTDAADLFKQGMIDADLSPEAEACIDEALNDDSLKEFFSLLFQGDEDAASQAMIQPLTACVTG